MKNRKRIIAFLMAISVISIPMVDSGTDMITASANESSQVEFAIVQQPKSVVVKPNTDVEFCVEVYASGLKYQWQYYNPAIGEWKNSSSGNPTTSTLSVTAIQYRNGFQYRCIITDKDGNAITSDAATLTIGEKQTLRIVKQPESITTPNNTNITFDISTSGENVTYQWQYFNPSIGEWRNSSSGNPTTDTLSVTATQYRNGFKYRCIVSDGETTITSDEAILTIGIKQTLAITNHPESATAILGSNVEFNVDAVGEGLKYQWQFYNPNEKKWTNSSLGNPNTKTLTVTATNARNGYQYRCIITDKDGNAITSDAATLTIASPLILTNPSSLTISDDSSATFTVSATGTGELTYLWESSVDSETWTAFPDSNSATLSVDGATAVSGTQYRCTVSDAYGQSKTSEPATLTVEPSSLQCGDNVSYTYKDGTVTISGEGEIWSYTDAASSPFASLDIDNLIIEDGVTVIGAHAFEGNSIQTVVLPESVFSIRYKAFWGNDNLDITIENIGCGIYDKALPDNATVHGYSNSSAYHSSQGANQTFINLDDDSAFDAQTNKIVLTIGDTYQIEADGSNLRYYSFNSDIVTVDNNGLVTAVAVDQYDTDAKVMVYDKAGRSTVYYFAVVDENTAPDYGWRYTIISPSSWDKSPFVPFWGQRVSLNEDVAEIVSWDHAQATGTFGTAPIISADDRGNAYIFYYTYDADIRPIKAEETYTEETYEITDDWQNAFYKPFYSYTAEEDTRVYFKAYGSEDLDVAVYSELSADPITSDYDGGRAEVSFDVKAGETVYIQPTAGQNKAFTYTMKLSTSAIETVSMIDNETYTITPDVAGDLTTLSFTAPADGNYLIEGKSNAPFHYELANNTNFTNVEYDDNGFQLENSSNWSHETWTDGTVLPYYVWLDKDETVYIRGYFDNETTSDDSLSFRAHAVTPVDTALTLNDMANPNVISLNPDNYDRRTIEGKAEAQYIISTDSTDNRAIVLDKDWNEVGLDFEWTETGKTYFFNCDEAQTYHVIVIPTQASENYGSVNVWVWENTDQEIDINLWDTYSFYNSRRAPVDYTFTAPMTGYYYLTSEYTGVTSYEWTDENGLVHEESFDPAFDMYIYDNDYNTLYNSRLTPGMSEKDSAFYLEEGQEVKVNFYHYELRGSDHIDFSLNWAKPGVLDVDSTQENAIDKNSCIWYEFTAPANGTYIFSAESNEGDMEFAFGSNGIEWISNNSSVEYSRDLSKDETVYVRIYSSENDGLSYSISVSNSNDEFNPTVLESIAPELSDNAETHSYTVNEKEAYIKLEYTPEALSYVLSIQNGYNLESMAVWFLNANGEGECVGYTNSDGIFTWDMTNDFFGDDDYVFVKLVTEQNPLGYISVDYTYEMIDDIIPDEICEECGGVNGEHAEDCSHFGEVIDDSDEDEYDEYINGLPVIATIDDEWEEYELNTDKSGVWLKVKMADGPYYNFEATCSVANRMYVYLASDMNTLVASDTYDDTDSRVMDFPYYDESGYAYVFLNSVNGLALGTINCMFWPAPIGM